MNEKMIFHQQGKDEMYKIWHASPEHMILYVYSGEGSIVCSETIYPLQKGTLCFVGSGKYHYTMPGEGEIYDRSKLLMLPEKFGKLLQIAEKESWHMLFSEGSFVYARVPNEQQAEVDGLFREMERAQKEKQFEDPMFIVCYIRMLILLEKYSHKATAGSITDKDVVNKAIVYINNHIYEELTIDVICADVHISKYYFCRRFKERIGMTVMEYILKTRVVLAQNMLQKETLSISEISERCGFSSVSYFCRVFKEETGKTPLKYKKRIWKNTGEHGKIAERKLDSK